MVKSTMAAQPRWPLASCITLAAIWVSSPCLESAAASAKPPKNKNSTGLAKSVSDLLMSKTPSRVASTGMERAVMVMLTASVSHRMAMKTRIPSPLLTLGSKGSQASMAQSSKTSRMTIPDLMSSQRDGVVEGTADVCILFSRLIYGCCCVAEITFIPPFETGGTGQSMPGLTESR